IFRGGANGEEPPLRVIQGPHTRILGTGYGGLDRVRVDGVHGEIYLPISTGQILVFPREANGDVAPKRVLNGVRGAITVDPASPITGRFLPVGQFRFKQAREDIRRQASRWIPFTRKSSSV